MRTLFTRIRGEQLETRNLLAASVYTAGHADIRVKYDAAEPNDFYVHSRVDANATVDGSQLNTPVEFNADDIVFKIPYSSNIGRTAGVFGGSFESYDFTGSEYDFLGTGVGEDLWVLMFDSADTSFYSQPYFGLAAISGIVPAQWSGSIQFKMTDFSGPGNFSIMSGAYARRWDTQDLSFTNDSTNVGAGGHNHYYWAFTEPGIYEVEVTVQGTHNTHGLVTGTDMFTFVIAAPLTADAGGPYTIAEGDALALAGSATGTGALDYSWDVNGDNVFGDATGATPTLTWSQLVALGISDGPMLENVTVRVSDAYGQEVDSSPTLLTVNNAPPLAGLSGPQVTKTGVSQNFTFLATDPAAADQAAGFTFDVDWDGDGTFDQSTSGLSGIPQLSHAYNTAGTYNVGVRATDKDAGTSSVFNFPVHVWRLAPVSTNVEWEGSGGDDVVEFLRTGPAAVEVRTLKIGGFTTNFVENFTGVTGRVIGKGNSGNDVLNGATLIDIPATLEGGRHNDTITGGAADDILRGEFVGASGDGAEGNDSITGGAGHDLIEGDGLEGGNDTLRGGIGNDTILGDGGDGNEGRADTIFGEDGDDQLFGHHGHDVIDGGNDNDLITGGDGAEANDNLIGGSGNDILSGSNGNDSLIGGAGKDLVVGGLGLDTIQGEGGEDLLIADQTSFGLNASALLAIHAEWISANSYATRVAHITGAPGGANGATYLIPGATVFDDELIDNMTGGADPLNLDWFIYNLLQDVLNDHEPGESEIDTAGFLML